jgi:hypothetical protein
MGNVGMRIRVRCVSVAIRVGDVRVGDVRVAVCVRNVTMAVRMVTVRNVRVRIRVIGIQHANITMAVAMAVSMGKV